MYSAKMYSTNFFEYKQKKIKIFQTSINILKILKIYNIIQLNNLNFGQNIKHVPMVIIL